MNEFLYKWLYLNLHCIRAVNSEERLQTLAAWLRGERHTEQLALLGALFNDTINSEYYITSVADKYRELVECYWQWKTNRRTGSRIRFSNNEEMILVQITGGPAVWKGVPGLTMLHAFLSLQVVSLFAHSTSNPLSRSQSHSATEGRCFRCNVKTCSLCVQTGEGGGARKICFTQLRTRSRRLCVPGLVFPPRPTLTERPKL